MTRDRRVRSRFALLLPALLLGAACEDEIGSPCAPDADEVEELLGPDDGQNRMAMNVNFTNCDQALCLSVQGSRGFCTIQCESDAACPADFRCDSPILTGPFACGPERYADNGNSCADVEPEDFIRYCTTDPSVIEARDGK